MKNWIKDRISEPTTILSLGMLAQSIMMLTKSNPEHVQAVAEIAQQTAEPIARGEYTTAMSLLFVSIAGIFMKEKAK